MRVQLSQLRSNSLDSQFKSSDVLILKKKNKNTYDMEVRCKYFE